MCGLAGRFHPAELPNAPGWATRAAELLAHRGPDGAGCYRDERCELVHRRLAIIDLTPAGRQPLTNEDGSVLVVYNGEIYNHRDLRAELQRRGHVFRGTSDSEVLVHLYEEHGDDFVERLRGMFAFALYDSRCRRLVLARDRYGIKPLFYTVVEGQWVFASEIKAIVALPGFAPRIDRQACYDFLGLGWVPEPATGFANIAALPKGTLLSVTAAGHRLAHYHTVVARPDVGRRMDQTVAAVADRLLAVVARQAAADVPVGALLSGGIDSSLVVAAHRRATGAETTTFSVRFPDVHHDESAAARAVAARYGTQHHTTDANERSLSLDAILDLFRHFDQPFADTSLIPTYWVSSAIRDRGIVCALSGDGGDEAFGGYQRFWQINQLSRLMNAPAWATRAAGRAGRTLAHWTRDWGRQVAKATQYAEAGRANAASLLAAQSNYLSEDDKETLVVPDARASLLPSWRRFDDGYWPQSGCDLEELSARTTEALFALSLPSDMLRKVDMMSMRASIEVRVPLLDEDVVALGLSLPHTLKTDGRAGKLVLRRLAERWLPSEVARRPKHGFTIPLDVMVPGGFHHAVADLILGSDARIRPLVNGPLVQSWLSDFATARNGRHGGVMSRGGLYQRIFSLLSLELWLRQHRLSW